MEKKLAGQNTEKQPKKQRGGNLAPFQFKKGQSGNPGGRPLGTRDFSTDFDVAVAEIAKLNKITRSEARITLLKVAYKNAKDGNYNFWRDIHDRIYGKPKESLEVDVPRGLRIDLFDYTKNARKQNRNHISHPKDTVNDPKDTSDTGGNGRE